MKVAFIQKDVHESLGVMLLCACIQDAGHEVDVFIPSLERDYLGRVEIYKPDIVCHNVLTGEHTWHAWVTARIREILPEAWIVCGGPHPTFFPQFVEEPTIDAICIGEGEGAIRELCNAYPDRDALRSIKNLHFKMDGETVRNELRSLVENLDTLPFAERRPFYKYPLLRRARRKKFLALRGCPYNCSFCFNHTLKRMYAGKGSYFRKRSPANIIGEILKVKSEFPLQRVFFQDDTLIVDKEWFLNFLEEYGRGVGLPYICFVRCDLMDEDIARALKESRCVGVHLGVESGNEGIRNRILRKNLTDMQIVNAAGLLKKNGIPFKSFNILGLPFESLEEMFSTAELNIRIRADFPSSSILAPYPGTDITDMMKREKIIPKDYDLDSLCSTIYTSKPVTRKEKRIHNFQRLFIITVKFLSLCLW